MTSKSLMRWTVVSLASLLLSGCQTLVRESIPGDWVEISAGSLLRLHRPVQIPVGRARAFFPSRGTAGGDASCALEVRRIDQEQVQTIAPRQIPITRVQHEVALVSQVAPPPGGERWFRLAGYGDGGGSQMVRFGYHFWLHDSQDPNLMRLTCLGRLDDPASTRAPTLAEIQAVLGDQASLEIAGGGF
ncbi:hypothetical protein [Thiocystis violacea]|uniref:hypothetical protein n=1 Tax=Thiocystis violacea TaxID=13725 RepID=UPI001908A39A|nr:hypothetical protein [Thiocystis violacea]MBK1723922.1 hypothetical protein [Thiocystis violacea]